MSRLDHLYRSLLLTKFFTKGWGNPENLKRLFEFRKILSCRETCQKLVPLDYPVHIDQDRTKKDVRIIEGHFVSPFTLHLPNIMPKESEIARFQMILPKNWDTHHKPVCIHLAGTGDHYFWRRRSLLARPLLKEAGIASIILENPYYIIHGVRKPKQQVRSSLHNVSDLFVMGGALVLESIVLLRWCEQKGYGPLGMTGISMGGHMASVAATNWHKPISLVAIMSGVTASSIYCQMASLAAASWPKPIVLVPCLSWSTASIVFTQGVLSGAIPWKLLQDQYFSDSSFEEEVAKLIESPEQARDNHSAFRFGQKFARNYPESLSEMESLQKSFIVTGSENKLPSKKALDSAANVAASASTSVTAARTPLITNTASSSSTTSARFHTTSASEAFGDSLRSMMHGWRPNTAVHDGDVRQREALSFMRGVMDEATHLGNFSKPVDTNLVIIVAARSDAYIPRNSVLSLEELWPGAEVRYIDTGHITAFLFKQGVFRKAIVDAFDRQIKKYYV